MIYAVFNSNLMLIWGCNLLIAKLHPQINSRLELNTAYIINKHAHFKYILKFKNKIK